MFGFSILYLFLLFSALLAEQGLGLFRGGDRVKGDADRKEITPRSLDAAEAERRRKRSIAIALVLGALVPDLLRR